MPFACTDSPAPVAGHSPATSTSATSKPRWCSAGDPVSPAMPPPTTRTRRTLRWGDRTRTTGPVRSGDDAIMSRPRKASPTLGVIPVAAYDATPVAPAPTSSPRPRPGRGPASEANSKPVSRRTRLVAASWKGSVVPRPPSTRAMAASSQTAS